MSVEEITKKQQRLIDSFHSLQKCRLMEMLF
jgi:hypothetical protein